MIEIAKNYYFVFGGLTIVGGIMGLVKKGSYISLVAGGLCGVLLLISALWLKTKPQNGLILGAVVSLVLAGQFIPAFIKKFNWMPAGLMAVLSVVGLIITALAFAKR